MRPRSSRKERNTIDSAMRPRSSSRERNTSASVTVTVKGCQLISEKKIVEVATARRKFHCVDDVWWQVSCFKDIV